MTCDNNVFNLWDKKKADRIVRIDIQSVSDHIVAQRIFRFQIYFVYFMFYFFHIPIESSFLYRINKMKNEPKKVKLHLHNSFEQMLLFSSRF